LLFLFDKEEKIIYQNKEIPSNLKYIFFLFSHHFIFFLSRNYVSYERKEKGGLSLNEILGKDKDFLKKVRYNLDPLKNSSDFYAKGNCSPFYELIFNRENEFKIKYFILTISNEKKM
jgi:hypothetical protein